MSGVKSRRKQPPTNNWMLPWSRFMMIAGEGCPNGLLPLLLATSDAGTVLESSPHQARHRADAREAADRRSWQR